MSGYTAHAVKGFDGFTAVVVPENGDVTWRGTTVHETEQAAVDEGEMRIAAEGLNG